MDPNNERIATVFSQISKTMKQWPPPTGLFKFAPQALPTDVFVTTSAKAGTLLTQYMSYLIVCEARGLGDDFEHIDKVTPWIDFYEKLNVEIPPVDGPYNPRVFKSHLPKTAFEKAGIIKSKHIVVIRNPLDMPSSILNMVYPSMSADLNDTGVDEDLVRERVLNILAKRSLLDATVEVGGRELKGSSPLSWFTHIESWCMPHPPKNALVLFYEDMIADFPATIRKIAEFMDVTLEDEQVEKVAELCSRENMASNPKLRNIHGAAFGMDPSKINRVNLKRDIAFRKYSLDEDVVRDVNARIEKEFGADCYTSLKEMILKTQKEMNGR